MSNSAKKRTVTVANRRIFFTAIGFGLFLLILFYSLFNLQIVNYAYYTGKVYDQITTTSSVKAERGVIYDSNMNVLATDKTVWRIFASPRQIVKRTKADGKDYMDIICRGVSEALAIDRGTVEKKLEGSAVLDVTLKKSATEEEYRAVLHLISDEGLDGMLHTEAQTSRYYPEGTLAAHVLGFVGSDLQGLYGLEYQYNSTLSGKDGEYLYAKDANGHDLYTGYSTYVPPTDGFSIVTTIDTYIQRELEEQLERISAEQSVGNRVTGIVMDTQTGAILAMGTSSPFDPNSPYELDYLSASKLSASGYAEGSDEYRALRRELLEISWANKAVSETYEPGSTFKIVTVSAALDAGAARISDKFSCHGYLSVGGWNIRCHKAGGHGSGFDLAYGLQMSCNPTMMTVASRLGAEKFYNYVDSFGYFEKTGIDLPSEARTIFHEKDAIGVTELATASFGQRFKVSVIRQLTSICAIANGGELVEPYVVQRIIDKDGNTISEHEKVVVRQVVSKEIANTVADVLEAGVSGDGGAKNAAVPGYKIAAKTGTSQKFDVLDENGNSYLRIGSTVAFNISDDGGIAVIIVVDEPGGTVKYGSVVAAPYASAFLTDALPYLGYEPEGPVSTVSIGNLVGMATKTATARLDKLGLKYEIVGNGDTVLAQTPGVADAFICAGGRVILYTAKDSELYATVPNTVGMTLSEANAALNGAGLNMMITAPPEHHGATVKAQSIAAGTVVPRNTVVSLDVLYFDFED